MNSTTTATVRDLITELSEVEDAVRRSPSTTPDGAASLNAELRSLMTRERDIIHELRRRRSQWRAACSPAHSLQSLRP
jgi:hypothetical protein